MLDGALRNINVGIQIRFRSGKLFKLSRLRASTEVLEELIQELLYADNCALEAHTFHDIQALTDSFANSASRFGLTINVQKTEVMFQPAPGKRTLIHKLTSMEFHLSLYHRFLLSWEHTIK